MTPQLTQSQWLELPTEVRSKLMSVFGIQKSGATFGTLGTFGKLQSDGCTDKDVSVLTIEAMQKYLGNYQTEDFYALFTQVLTKFSSEEQPIIKEVEVEHPIYERWKQDLVKMRDESEKTDLALKLKHMVWEIFPQPINKNVQSIQKTGTNKGSKKGGTA